MITADITIEGYLVGGTPPSLPDIQKKLDNKSSEYFGLAIAFSKLGADKFLNSLWRAEEFLEVWLTTEESFYDNRRNY